MADEMNRTVSDPVTKDMLKHELTRLGVTGNQIIEVHASLSSFDHVIGGAQAIVDALMELSGTNGTLLMPVQNMGNSEPSDWKNPGISAHLYRDIRESILPSDGRTNDINDMGAVAENFRHREGVIISSHPSLAYAAWGRYAKLLCNRQSFHFPLADESPCARLYEMKGLVLLLGVGYDKCTCMHMAEYRCDCRPVKLNGACVQTEEGTQWRKYMDLDLDTKPFNRIGEIMESQNQVRKMELGGSTIRLFAANTAVDEAVKYLERTVVYDLYR